MSSETATRGLFDPHILGAASLDALRKLDPRALAKNPVIFVTEIVSFVVTGVFLRDLFTPGASALFSGQIAFWLWFTVIFANFAEAVAEGRGKAQADTLRKSRSDTRARRYVDINALGEVLQGVNALDLRVGDIVLVEAGETIPGDCAKHSASAAAKTTVSPRRRSVGVVTGGCVAARGAAVSVLRLAAVAVLNPVEHRRRRITRRQRRLGVLLDHQGHAEHRRGSQQQTHQGAGSSGQCEAGHPALLDKRVKRGKAAGQPSTRNAPDRIGRWRRRAQRLGLRGVP